MQASGISANSAVRFGLSLLLALSVTLVDRLVYLPHVLFDGAPFYLAFLGSISIWEVIVCVAVFPPIIAKLEGSQLPSKSNDERRFLCVHGVCFVIYAFVYAIFMIISTISGTLIFAWASIYAIIPMQAVIAFILVKKIKRRVISLPHVYLHIGMLFALTVATEDFMYFSDEGSFLPGPSWMSLLPYMVKSCILPSLLVLAVSCVSAFMLPKVFANIVSNNRI